MSDVNCPYCDAEQEINHDDGRGYSEDARHEQQCEFCEKYFVFTTYISYSYDAYKADCLNGANHDFKPSVTYPKEYTKMECTQCEERRKPTDEEWKEILK